MKITVLSQAAAIEKAKNLNKSTSIISITEPLDENIEFEKTDNLKDIFRMQFFDLEVDFKSIEAPKQKDFNGLKNFVDNINCDELIIHCYAGVSRSAAVAAAISEYLKINLNIFNSQDFDPNKLVYKLACKELNIEPINHQNNFYAKDIIF